MTLKFLRIALILSSFIFLNGFLPFSALLGPGITIASSGNIYKASAQFMVDRHIKNKTGKNSLDYVKEEVAKNSYQKDMNEELRRVVKKRIELTHKKIEEQNITKDINKELIELVEKRIAMSHKKLIVKKINQ